MHITDFRDLVWCDMVHEYQCFRITTSTFILLPWRWKQYIYSKHWHVSSDIMVTVFCVVISYTRGSQKVPGMVVLKCNGRTYGNAYLITFKVGPSSEKWSEIQTIGIFLPSKKVLHNKLCVVWCVIVMQKPLSLPLVVPLPLICIMQPL
jgi:hypothetical protein